MRHAAALDAQQLPALGAARNLERHRPRRRRDLDGRAERGLRVRDRDVEDEIGAAALEERRRLDLDHDEEVARRAAVVAGLALALEPHLRAALRAGGNLHGVALRHAFAAAAAAVPARRLDDRAVPAAARARLREREQPLRASETTPRPPHVGQTTGAVPGSAPVPWQTEQAVSTSTGTRTCTPSSESSNEMRTRVSRSFPRIGCLLARAPAAPAEHPAEDVAEVAEVELLEAHAARSGPAPPGKPRAPASPYVSYAFRFSGVREHVVRALHLLEALLGAVVAGVAIRVVLARELAVRLLDVVVGRVLRHAEHLVRVTRHRPTLWMKSSGSSGETASAVSPTSTRTTRARSVTYALTVRPSARKRPR